jgi:hypothetical protein
MRSLLTLCPALLLVACGSSPASLEDGGAAGPDAAGTGADASGGTADAATPSDSGARQDAAHASADASGPADSGSAPGCLPPEAQLPSWASGFVAVKEIYLSPSGDDAKDGSSPAQAIKTTAAGIKKLAPGVRLNFAAGAYACPYLESFAGTTAAPGVFRSSDGPRKAVFDCQGQGGFYFTKVTGLWVDGVEIANTSGHGIQVDSGSPFDPAQLSGDFLLTGSYVHDTGLACLKAAQSNRLTLLGNEFARCNTSRQMVEFVACSQVVVALNEGHHSGQFDEVKGGAKGGVIFGNYVHDTAGGILVGGDCTGQQFLVDPAVDYEARDLRVFGNVLANVTSEAFRVVSCHDCTVANNTYWTTSPTSAIRVLASGFGSPTTGQCDALKTDNKNLRVVNNVFAATKPFTYMIPSTAPTSPGLVMTNNLWFGGAGQDVTKTGSDIPFKAEPSSLYSVDPGFVGPPADLHPAAGSPVLGKGSMVDFVVGDQDGKCWPGLPDIGAL